MKINYEIYSSIENGFFNSRTALKKLLEDRGFVVNDLKKDLELNQFRELPRFPHFYTSLSHTKELAAAILIPRSEITGLGIDIEWADRVIKPGTEKFFLHEKDHHELSPIEVWTAKEAAFKALSPIGTYPGTLVLSKIIIKGNIFYTEEEPKLMGNICVHKNSINDKNYIFTIAIIPKEVGPQI